MVESAGKKISVIVPVYNAVGTLERSVRSLIEQTLADIEIIIVNDASIDGSGNIISALADECHNLIVIDLPENQGVHRARMVGLEAATTPWVGFLDADDFARPTMYEEMYSAGIEKGVDVVACGSYRVTADRKILSAKIRYDRNRIVTENIFLRFCEFEFGTGILWNKLYRRALVTPVANLQFPWRQDINEDLIFSIGVFSEASSLYLMKAMLHEYALEEKSATATIGKADAFVEIYRAFAVALSVYEGLGEEVLAAISSLYRRQLEFPAYQLKSLEDLHEHKEKLQEATDMVVQCYPIGLAVIAARVPRPNIIKRTLSSVFSRIGMIATKFTRA
tara:strand:+ start:1084 stop:2088 length:1005 start_codon:yes stop_codon:yes gene_type:complete